MFIFQFLFPPIHQEAILGSNSNTVEDLEDEKYESKKETLVVEIMQDGEAGHKRNKIQTVRHWSCYNFNRELEFSYDGRKLK